MCCFWFESLFSFPSAQVCSDDAAYRRDRSYINKLNTILVGVSARNQTHAGPRLENPRAALLERASGPRGVPACRQRISGHRATSFAARFRPATWSEPGCQWPNKQVLKHEWPQRWPTFIPELVSSAKNSETLCENSMHILKASWNCSPRFLRCCSKHLSAHFRAEPALSAPRHSC